MTGMELLMAAGDIRDDLIEAAVPKGAALAYPPGGRRLSVRKALLLAAVIAMLAALAATAYSFARRYASPIENTQLYCYTASGRVDRADAEQVETPEQAARLLAQMFLEDLCTPSDERTFRITAYRGLSVEVLPTLSMDEETRAVYDLRREELGENTWIVEIGVEYQYEGTLSPVGPSSGQWIDILYQASPVGFLMTESGGSYTLQSRYR